MEALQAELEATKKQQQEMTVTMEQMVQQRVQAETRRVEKENRLRNKCSTTCRILLQVWVNHCHRHRCYSLHLSHPQLLLIIRQLRILKVKTRICRSSPHGLHGFRLCICGLIIRNLVVT
ncbi:hypothetical protein SEVIR_8G246920v4 [Setaria viridis]